MIGGWSTAVADYPKFLPPADTFRGANLEAFFAKSLFIRVGCLWHGRVVALRSAR